MTKKEAPHCLRYFSASSKIIKPVFNNSYGIKVTNCSKNHQEVNLVVSVSQNKYACASVNRFININPTTSSVINLDCDWDKSAHWVIDDCHYNSDGLWKNGFTQKGFYSIVAELFDREGRRIESIKIYQKLEI